MAQRSYAPQLARMLQRIVRYDSKHRAKVFAVATAQQQTDLLAIISAINNSWASVQTTEQP